MTLRVDEYDFDFSISIWQQYDVEKLKEILGDRAKIYIKESTQKKKIDDDVAKLLSEKHNVNAKILIFNSRGAMSTKGSLLGNVFQKLGIENMADRYDIPPGTVLNKEQVVACNPDVFILIDWTDGGYFPSGEVKLKEMYGDPSFAELKAIKNKKVILQIIFGILMMLRLKHKKCHKYQ